MTMQCGDIYLGRKNIHESVNIFHSVHRLQVLLEVVPSGEHALAVLHAGEATRLVDESMPPESLAGQISLVAQIA